MYNAHPSCLNGNCLSLGHTVSPATLSGVAWLTAFKAFSPYPSPKLLCFKFQVILRFLFKLVHVHFFGNKLTVASTVTRSWQRGRHSHYPLSTTSIVTVTYQTPTRSSSFLQGFSSWLVVNISRTSGLNSWLLNIPTDDLDYWNSS